MEGIALLLALATSANAQGPFGGSGNGYGGFGGFNGSGSGNNGNSNGNGNGNGNNGNGNGLGQNGAGFDIDQAMSYRTIHGVLAAVAFVGFFPLGAILMRVIPGRHAWIVHAITQVLGYIVYIAGAALGIYLIQMVRIPPNNTSLLDQQSTRAHPIIGLVVLAVVFFQPLLGWVHHVQFKRLARRTWWSHAHIWVGRAALTLGMINGGLGLQISGAGRSAITAYAVVAGIMWLLWMLSAVVAEWRRRRGAGKAADHDEMPLDGRRVGEEHEEEAAPPYTPGPVWRQHQEAAGLHAMRAEAPATPVQEPQEMPAGDGLELERGDVEMRNMKQSERRDSVSSLTESPHAM